MDPYLEQRMRPDVLWLPTMTAGALCLSEGGFLRASRAPRDELEITQMSHAAPSE